MAHDHHLVGAKFPERASAMRAAARLRADGLAERGLQTALWSDHRYVVESHAPRRIGRSLVIGAIVGACTGAVVGALVMLAVFPEFAALLALLVGAIIGSGLGTVWGAYWGIGKHESELWDESDWAHIDLGPGELLVVVEADSDSGENARLILRDAGGTPVEPVHPR